MITEKKVDEIFIETEKKLDLKITSRIKVCLKEVLKEKGLLEQTSLEKAKELKDEGNNEPRHGERAEKYFQACLKYEQVIKELKEDNKHE